MGNDSQFRPRTRYVATRGVFEYRQTIATVVTADDVVLELGCEWGTTSVLLAAACKHVIGTDISRDCIDRARRSHPGIRFEVLDAFDVRAALDLGLAFNKIYMDLSGVSGYRSLLDLLALLNMYATVLRPELIVVKSGALKQLAGRCTAWNPGPVGSRRPLGGGK